MYHSSGFRSSRLEVFLGKSALKICGKFTGYHPCRSVISIKLQSNFIEITLRHGYSPVNSLHIFRLPFCRNTSGWLLMRLISLRHFCSRKKIIKAILFQWFIARELQICITELQNLDSHIFGLQVKFKMLILEQLFKWQNQQKRYISLAIARNMISQN